MSGLFAPAEAGAAALRRTSKWPSRSQSRWPEAGAVRFSVRRLTSCGGVIPADAPQTKACSVWEGRGARTATSSCLPCVLLRPVSTCPTAKGRRARHLEDTPLGCNRGGAEARGKALARNELPWSAISFRYCRSSKPGGSSVNKSETKAVLQVPLRALEHLVGDDLFQVLCKEWRHSINKNGELMLSSERYSSQSENKKDCISRLDAILTELKQRPKAGKGKDPREFKCEAAQQRYKARLLEAKRKDQYNRRCLQVHQRRS